MPQIEVDDRTATALVLAARMAGITTSEVVRRLVEDAGRGPDTSWSGPDPAPGRRLPISAE